MPGVFISYAREDQEFARRLYDALLAAGREPTWDQDHEAVPFSAQWRPEIQAAIDNSDKFVFVISPDSLDSGPCANEFDRAMQVSKHVIPIVARTPRAGQEVPRRLEELNWIFCTSDADFDRAVGQLIVALDTDLAWTKDHTRLLTRSAEWTGKQDGSLLLRGSDLRAAEDWLARSDQHARTPPTAPQVAYIAASRRAASRSARLWRGALASGLAVALVLATIAFIQRNSAQHNALLANARADAASAIANLDTKPALSLREALTSTQKSPDAGLAALRLALAADRLRMAFQPGFGTGVGLGTQATWSPAAEIIAATARGNSVQLWNPRTGRLLRRLGSLPAADPITQVSYNGPGTLLAAIASNGLVALWNPQDGRAVGLGQLNAAIRAGTVGRHPFVTGVWNPQNGDLYVSGPDLRDILVYRPSTGHVYDLNWNGPVVDLAFAPTGSRALLVQDSSSILGIARIVNFSTGKSLVLRKPASLVGWGISTQACWTPDGSEIVTWNPEEAQDQTLRVFSPQTGTELFERAGVTYSAAACGATTALGPYVAAGDYAGEGTLVQTRDFGPFAGRNREFTAIGLYGHTQLINSVATSPDGNYIATGSDDGTVRIWDAVSGRQLSLIGGNGMPVESVQFSPRGGAVLAVTASGTVLVADAGVGEPDVPLQTAAAGRAYALGFADGSRLIYGVGVVTQGGRGAAPPAVSRMTALLWRADTGRLAASDTLPAPPDVGRVTCPSAWAHGTSSLCVTPAQEFAGFSVSPDGAAFAYATAGGVVARRFTGGDSVRLPLAGPVTGLTFTGPDDDLLVLTNRVVDVWRPFGGGYLRSVPQRSPPLDAELSADGRRLATASGAGYATVWEVGSARPVATFRPRPVPNAGGQPLAPDRVALSASGAELALGTESGAVELWAVAAHRLIARHVLISTPTQVPYPIAELTLSGNGSNVVAVNYPQISAGDAEPAGKALVMATATGRVTDTLGSPGQLDPPVNPAVALSPGGGYLLGGTEGFAPATAEAGSDAVYEVTAGGGHELADLQNAVQQVPTGYPLVSNLIAVNAWAADGVHLLTGGPAVYACDSCGSLAQMQAAARLRLEWANPLTAARDKPPSGDAFS